MDLTKIRENNGLKTAAFVLSIIGAVISAGMAVMNLLFIAMNSNLYKSIIINLFSAAVLVLIAMSTKAYKPNLLKAIAGIKCGVYIFSIIQVFLNFTFSFSSVFGMIVDILCIVCLAGALFFLINKNRMFAAYAILIFCALNLLVMLITLVIDLFSEPSGIITFLTTFITGIAFNIIPIAFVFLPHESLENFE